MRINQTFKLSLGVVLAGVFASAAYGQEVASEKKAEGKPFVKAFSEVQLRLFNDYNKDQSGELSDATTYQTFRPLLGATVLDGAADVSIRTNILKEANSVQVKQLQPIANLTINNLNFGPLSMTPYIEHYLPGANTAAFTEVYLDNIVSQKLELGFGTLALSGEVELMTKLQTNKSTSPVKEDKRVEMGLISPTDAATTTETKDPSLSHEWNVGVAVSPAAAKGLTIGLQQFLTNTYAPVYTVEGDDNTTAGYPLEQRTWERLAVSYKINDTFQVVNYTDLLQKGTYEGNYDAGAGLAPVMNQTRLIYTLF